MSLEIVSTSSDESADFIASFLNTHASGVLSTSDVNGNPHSAVVYFSLQKDFSLTFATKTETQKYKNMQENTHVAFAVYNEREQTAVQVTGRVEVITDPEKKHEAIAFMYGVSPKLSMSALPPAAKLTAGGYVAFRLIPAVIKMAIYSRPDEERDDIYETILFSE